LFNHLQARDIYWGGCISRIPEKYLCYILLDIETYIIKPRAYSVCVLEKTEKLILRFLAGYM
jgi:hypothetical protein